ncbi:conserved hypothetical protein [Histoplasma capsulatum G186AR]|uniref:C2H2-type domain-containing protein n=2 Tax=Ajellomyces capsulatus TaxID=5037 RepID=C0NMN7_AJECG|nr:uncharacterized protein HCBG_04014 [Histoplasma capsulatum G186AR]EEH07135.1 conserved hypothetical protein [Histoplasma capsulatum G186AR]KAG5287843.1 C2H2 finger domain-containing protein [Histoplasma capsulatum]QSS70341.1 C2H2 finger domain-containing protein [Histoplasma capsulatum G186AR]
MASFKESLSSTPSRPISHTTPPLRQSNGRHHSHSVSLGAVNINHRVTRRKSMTSAAASSAATAAAVAVAMGESPSSAALSTSSSHLHHHRRALNTRKAVESTSMGASSGFTSYLARNAAQDATPARKNSPNSIDENTAVEDVSPLAGGTGAGNNSSSSISNGKPISTKQRSRRASEGSHLIRSEGKRVMNELRCDRCGKGYKHSSCLTKHMWEHDPAWAYTSKLLISKHQQVQLLEAASVLVNMNPDTPASSVDHHQPTGESDRSSTSPTASGISELRDGNSSAETTPPPTGEEGIFAITPAKLSAAQTGVHARPHNRSNSQSHSFRFSTNNFSRSFQSIPSSSFTDSAPTLSPSHSHFRQSSTDTRPSTAETGGLLDDDEAGLAAAIELCHFGTPRSGPVPMSPDIPPVPPLPAKFVGSQSMGVGMGVGAGLATTPNNNSHNHNGINGINGINNSSQNNTHSFDVLANVARHEASSTPTIYNPLNMHPSLSYRVSDVRDVKMDDAQLLDTRGPISGSNGSRVMMKSTKTNNNINKRNADDIVGAAGAELNDEEEDGDDFAHDRGGSVVPMDDDDDGVFGRMEE